MLASGVEPASRLATSLRHRNPLPISAPLTFNENSATSRQWRASRQTEGALMGAGDKMENAAEEFGGKAKEAAGKMTDDEKMEAEGKADQTKANIKQAGEDVKDAFTE
jgi:uncharacterized protein YjbJ (UPF0337 family)